MRYKLVIKEEAIADATEAFLYYEEKSDGLGERFLESLEHYYLLISENPSHYSYIYADNEKTMRDVKIRGFPFVVIYDIVGYEVVVYAVHNCSKDRKY